MPIFHEKVWIPYHEEIDIFVNVVDKKTFPVEDIPQGYDPSLHFEQLAKRECEYIPSWVILDANQTHTLSSCGTEKDIEDILKEIQRLLEK